MMSGSNKNGATFSHHSSLITPLQSFPGDVLDEVADAAGVAPLVVVPREHLDEAAADDLGVLGVNYRGVVVLAEVHRDERLLREGEDAAQLLVGRVLQGRVDLLGRHVAL